MPAWRRTLCVEFIPFGAVSRQIYCSLHVTMIPERLCVHMIDGVETKLHGIFRRLHRLLVQPRVQLVLRLLAYFTAGLVLSAASLCNSALPLGAALVCACSGWMGLPVALGAVLGYRLFWAQLGTQGIFWSVGALVCSLSLNTNADRQMPLLRPALAGFLVSACGVMFQLGLGDETAVGVYVLRVALVMGSTWLFRRVMQTRVPLLDWLTWALGVLALAQILPVSFFSLGVVAAGLIAVTGAFPAAAFAGLALDLSGVCRVSMTAVLCAGYLLRFLPRLPRWLGSLAPGLAYLLVMALSGTFHWYHLPALVAGGLLGTCLPLPKKTPARRGETGVAQVRLEMAAGALLQTLQLLLEAPEIPVDEDALVERAGEQACMGCPHRKVCKDSPRLAQLPAALLHKPLMTSEELPIICKKSGRYLAQLHRAQEQLRSIRADRERQREYREALIQQYGFLARFLQRLSDSLTYKAEAYHMLFSPRVQIFGNRPKEENGDRVLSFAGVGNRYYVLLCDGMGTGMGAVSEGKTAQMLLHRMLVAGFPGEHALQSLNSICALRGRAGAVTVDLLELQLDTGRGALYKWGAVPSYVISPMGAEKIGTAGPPPGLSVTDRRDTVYQLSLRRGETLVLVSDGVGEEEALHCCLSMAGASPGELAKSLLTCSQFGGEDDATVVLVELRPDCAAS